MPKKGKAVPTRREWEDADLAWKCDGRTYRVILLAKGEHAPLKTSSNYDHCAEGPAVVVIEEGPNGTRVDERDLHDRRTWDWIGRLMRDGLTSYGEITMLSTVDLEAHPLKVQPLKDPDPQLP